MRYASRLTRPLKLTRALTLLLSVLAALSFSGCLKQIDGTAQTHNVSLEAKQLETYGLAVITPTSVTGQEEDRQSVALIFALALEKHRPDIPLSTLSETIGHINRNGMATEYRSMFEEYHFTGIFKQDALMKVGKMTGHRYLAQLKLANFSQSSQSRLSFFGLRLFQTKSGNIRLFLSVWDSWDGSIVWEGMDEVNFAYDTFQEKPITFRQVVREASTRLVSRLP
ncbi:MAG: hypothetical protein SCI25_14805 [Desulfuromonadales bacterium]|nr:hypothetical protein [Desulfuromonadales bacterium]MDW7758633.1 hypothetical protein [Desulfuromonadales bacterium]